MGSNASRLVIAGLSGDSGKTIVSLSLAAVLRRRGQAVSVFKKGPDYIDAAWLALVAGGVCRNLDTYMVPEGTVRDSFAIRAGSESLALIEGNRGLFDGKDAQGTHSTAGLAKLLQAPIVLVIDCTKATRTVAALVHGCQTFDSDVHIAGAVLNRVAGRRHGQVISEAIGQYCGVPVLGVIPKLFAEEVIPGRHLGLVPPAEYEEGGSLVQRLADIAEDYLDIDGLLGVAAGAGPLAAAPSQASESAGQEVRIGYFRDSVFTFYYPENIEALARHGAELVPISSLTEGVLPEIDALYIGGGFPETHAERLAANQGLMQSVREAASAGMPVYAECGGLIYLARSLAWQGKRYPMAGVFDIDLRMNDTPIGHGYTELAIDRENPYFACGGTVRGHEFHYSEPVRQLDDSRGQALVRRGTGLSNGRDGLVQGQTMAMYTHIHAEGVPEWAPALVRQARMWRARQGKNTAVEEMSPRRQKREETGGSTRWGSRSSDRPMARQ